MLELKLLLELKPRARALLRRGSTTQYLQFLLVLEYDRGYVDSHIRIPVGTRIRISGYPGTKFSASSCLILNLEVPYRTREGIFKVPIYGIIVVHVLCKYRRDLRNH